MMKLKATLMFLAALALAEPCLAVWTNQEVDPVGSSGQYPSIKIDSHGFPHISYCDGSGTADLKYARWNGTSWEIATVDSAGIVGSYTSLALDAEDHPHITYYSNTDRQLKYASWNGSAWEFQVVDPVCPNIGSTSLALDAVGHPRVAYFVNNGWNNGGYRVKYAEWTGTSWSTSTVDTENNNAHDNGGMVSLALDASGTPHLAYFYAETSPGPDYNWYRVKYAKWTGASWSVSKVDWGAVYAGSLALDASGTPHIAICAVGPSYNVIKHARQTGSTWDISPLQWDHSAVNGWVGGPCAMALDAAANPHVVCVDNSGYFFHVFWNGFSWSTEKIDSRSGLNQYNAVTIDAQGQAHTAYYDNANSALRYATQAGGPVLSWTGEAEYLAGGVAPQTGKPTDEFVFRVQYADPGGRAPAAGYPRVVISRGETVLKTVPLNYVSGNYTIGAIYSTSTVFMAVASSASYCFEASNTAGISARVVAGGGPLVQSSAPSLAWTGETGYADAGIAPREGTVATTFAFRVRYADADGDAPAPGYPRVVIRNGAGIVRSIPMNYVSGNSATGAVYSTSTAFSSPATDLSCSFEACDRWGAAATVLSSTGPLVTSNCPSLAWTGEQGFADKGVSPDGGYELTDFTFRVRYADVDNDAPAQGDPKLHVQRGGREIDGSPFAMREADPRDTAFTDGKIYVRELRLPGGLYTYYMECCDASGARGTGPSGALNVSGLALPVPGQVKVVGTAASRGLVNPDKGETVKIYFTGERAGTFTCRILNSAGELLFEAARSDVNFGVFEWVPRDIASGIYIARVEGPGLNVKKKIAIIR